MITTGGSEAITIAFMSTLNPGDEIIIPEPFYANYTAFALMCGVKVKTVTSSIENNFALPPISEIEKVITPRTKGIVIVNPNNPTGYLYSKEELEQLAVIVKNMICTCMLMRCIVNSVMTGTSTSRPCSWQVSSKTLSYWIPFQRDIANVDYAWEL